MTARAPPGLRWGQINPIRLPPEGPLGLTTAAQPHSPVEDPFGLQGCLLKGQGGREGCALRPLRG